MTVLVLGLLGGTVAAFGVTQALKLERWPLVSPRVTKTFSPACRCASRVADLSFRLRRSERLDAVVVDADGETIRTLASDSERPRGRVALTWDGSSDAGERAPDGAYRLRVHLERRDRTILIPNVFRVDTRAPQVELLTGAALISPDGDGRNDALAVEYETNEKSRASLLVDGSVVVRGQARPAGRRAFTWPEQSVGAGVRTIAVEARDMAGNRTVSQSIVVRVRFVELEADVVRARRGGLLRFRVDTDVVAFRWVLESRRGRPLLRGTATRASVTVRLPRRLRRGEYALRVSARGHGDRARVVVRAAR